MSSVLGVDYSVMFSRTVAHPESELLEFRLRTVRVGLVITLVMLCAIGAYVALTWEWPHRPALAMAGLAAGVVALTVWALFRQRVAGSGREDLVLAGWNVTSVVLASVAACLDGGPTSPMIVVLFVSVAFAAVALPRHAVAAIAALDVLALLLTCELTSTWTPSVVMWVVGLTAVATAGEDVAADRWRRAVALQTAGDELCRRLAGVVEHRDDDTGAHMVRMSEYCRVIATRLGWAPTAAAQLRSAATMHDIGKVAIPDQILRKCGPLTDLERETMQQHTLVGHHMLTGSSEPILQTAAVIALTHHERWDGGGYPQGLAGEGIPVVGRIVAVADVFDALTSDRVYRAAMPVATALAELESERGRQLEPAVLDAFRAGLEEILTICAADRDG